MHSLRVERKKKAPECHWAKLVESKKTKISKKMLKKSEGKSKRGRKPKNNANAKPIASVANTISKNVQSSINIEDAIMIEDDDETEQLSEAMAISVQTMPNQLKRANSPANSVIYLSSLTTFKDKKQHQQHKRQRSNLAENGEPLMPKKKRPYKKQIKSQPGVDLLELNKNLSKEATTVKVCDFKDKITKRLERSIDKKTE
jgi:hypothetical protein